MNEKITVVIPGTPTAWARCGINRGSMYDTQKHKKLVFALHVKNQLPNNFTLFSCCPVYLEAHYFFPLPKRTKHKPQDYHFKTPDIDNLNKFVCDALKTILFEDDRLIAHNPTSKRYDTNPRTELTFYALGAQ